MGDGNGLVKFDLNYAFASPSRKGITAMRTRIMQQATDTERDNFEWNQSLSKANNR